MTTPEVTTPEPKPEPQPQPKETPPAEPKTFSEDEVNAMTGRVRAQERAKYSDYGTLKERAKKADELEAANLSDKERLERKAANAERKAIDADARIADTAIRAEVRMRAVQKGIVDPDAAFALVDRTDIEYSDDNGVSGVDPALDALLVAKPYLKGTVPGAPNLNPEGVPPQAPVKLTDAQRATAQRFGVSEENYAKHRRTE